MAENRISEYLESPGPNMDFFEKEHDRLDSLMESLNLMGIEANDGNEEGMRDASRDAWGYASLNDLNMVSLEVAINWQIYHGRSR